MMPSNHADMVGLLHIWNRASAMPSNYADTVGSLHIWNKASAMLFNHAILAALITWDYDAKESSDFSFPHIYNFSLHGSCHGFHGF
jgi:hypothetical protein